MYTVAGCADHVSWITWPIALSPIGRPGVKL